MEALLFSIGQAVAGVLFKSWLENSPTAKKAGSSIKDVIRGATDNAKERRSLGREFERISEQIAERLSPYFEIEFGGIPSNEKRAAGDAVRKTLEEAKLTDARLFSLDLVPQALEEELRRARPDAAEQALLSEAGAAFYDLLLREAANYIVEIRLTLPDFGSEAARTLLQRETELIELVRTVLERLPEERSWLDGSEAATFEAQYRRDVARKFDRLVLFGLTTAESRYKYSLSVAYLTLTVSTLADRTGEEGDVRREDVAEDNEEDRTSVPVDAALESRSRILVRGEAGSGKTTLLQWLAINSARGTFKALKEWNDTVPFLIQLRRFVDSGLPAADEFAAGVNSARQQPDGWAQRQLDDGRALILVDGIDELPEERRAEAREWLAALVDAFPRGRYVVTSRPPAVGEDWLAEYGFDSVLLEPMELPAIRSFIDHWHAAALGSISDQDERADLEDLADRLKDIVRGNRAIRSLASSPLLCAMLCALNRDRRAQLPSDRIELYRIALEMMLDRRDIERRVVGDVVDLGLREKEILLRVFALWLLDNGMSYARRADLENLVATRLEGMPRVTASAQDVVKNLLIRSGVLRQPVEGHIDFIHRTFQEYLAAKEAVETRSIGVLVEHAHLDQWQEVVVLAAGLATLEMREALITALIERGESDWANRHRLHLLAVGCLETSAELSAELAESVNVLLSELIPPRSMTEARSIASAGEVAVALLGKRAGTETAAITAACVRALSLIGGESALVQLERFGPDQRVTVARELIRAWGEYPSEEFAQRVLRKSRLDYGHVEVTTPGQLAGVAYLEQLQSLDCDGTIEFTPGDEWPWEALSTHPSLRHLRLSSISGLTELPSLASGEKLTMLEIDDMPELVALPAGEMPSLNRLSLRFCMELTSMPGLGELDQLGAIEISTCFALKELPRLPPSLERAYFDDLEIDDISSLAGCPNLKVLKLESCPAVADLSSLATLRELEVLSLDDCRSLYSVDALAEMDQLEVVSLAGASGLTEVDSLANCSFIRELAIEDAPDLNDVRWVAELENLKTLSFSGCTGIRDLPPLVQSSLRSLHLSGCPGIEEVEFLEGLDGLEELYLDFCDLDNVESLEGLRKLSYVSLMGCTRLEDISVLEHLPELEWLDLRGCPDSLDTTSMAENSVFVRRYGGAVEHLNRSYIGIEWNWQSDRRRFPPYLR
jgi:Leucine-rich repeat (LRR) protein